MNDNYLEHLNDKQREAVLQSDGPVMIIAGAGSGKTRVLTYRIAHLIRQGADPFNILALTFTNKAAREMKDRIVRLVGPDARNLWMGTFHSVFARILRFECEKLNYASNFTIYDTEDSKNLIKSILSEQGLDDKVYKPGSVLSRISAAKSSLMSAAEYNNNTDIVAEDRSTGKPQMGYLYELYTKRCFNAGAMDFDDLLYNTFKLLKNFPEVLHKYQHRFKYILVDEYQDTNFAQYIIIKKLAALNENICVVGDDAQSIYAFRGANIQNILSYEKDYPDLKIFKLEQNYRSTANIVNIANSAIGHNRDQIKKTVWTHNEEGDKIKVLRALSDNEEGMLVANTIFQSKMNHQMHNKEFAILYRTNSQSRSMEEALRRLNIPYRIYGGLSFYHRKEIKDLLAYFRMSFNPHDEEALKRIINYPARGIGKTTVEKISITAAENDVSLWEVICEHQKYPAGLNSGTLNRIKDFVTMIRSFQVMVPVKDAYEVASHIAGSTGILKELYNDRSPEGISRYENIQELLNGIKEFTQKVEQIKEAGEEFAATNEGEYPDIVDRKSTLDIFMQDIALLTDSDADDPEGDDKVSLMTIHAAKGLEFPQVFVVGLEENLFPSYLSVNSRSELEEERRLFYVAITRAQKRLIMTYASSRYRWGQLSGCEPSRFLEELDPAFMDVQVQKRSQVKEEAIRSWSGGLGNKQPVKTSTPSAMSLPKNLRPINRAQQSTPATADFDAADPAAIEVGMTVEHQRFGKGTVVKLEGSLANRKAMIDFPAYGQKQLLLKFARLRIVT
ncbi:MAG: ATP-dependent helicase [Bacteroidia bacterium]